MKDSLHAAGDGTLAVTIELIGLPSDLCEESAPPGVSIRRLDVVNSSSLRIQVSLPRLVNTENARHAVDMLSEDLGALGCPFLAKTVKMVGLRFTAGGISGITTFLHKHASEANKLILNDIICGRIVPADEANFLALCQIFRDAELEIIDLSYNAIGPYVWQAFDNQKGIKTLFLHDIEMEDESFQSLHQVFAWGHTLINFHVANLARTGTRGVEAMNGMLTSCDSIRTFAWLSDSQIDVIPAVGLAKLSKNMLKNKTGCLKSLEISGGIINIEETDENGICEALGSFPRLEKLKLRHAGLNSDKIKRIVTALRSARPPLSCIDLAFNDIDCEGAHWVAQLSRLKAVTKNLKILNLEHNSLEKKGALEVVDAFACKSSDFHLMLNGNAFDWGSLALSLASAKHLAGTELSELRKEHSILQAAKDDAQSNLRELLSAQSAMLNDMNELKAKSKQLEEDKQNLIKAFSVLGMMEHIKERDILLKRLSNLEERVIGNSEKMSSTRSTSRACVEIDELPDPTCLSRPNTPHESHPPQIRRLSPTPNSGRRAVRPSARGLLVKAASERWRNLIAQPNSSKGTMSRTNSTKSLAEFLKSDLDSSQHKLDDISLEEHSIQTTPATLGDLRSHKERRKQLKLEDSTNTLESDGYESFRSLPAFDSQFVRKSGNSTTLYSSLDSLPSDNGRTPST